jgi:DNA-binding transcriptional regulator YiaG
MTEAALFHRCRRALGLSQPAMARALLIAQDRTIRRWEQDEQAISGPAWVALEGMLRGKGETALADRVVAVIEQRRQR